MELFNTDAEQQIIGGLFAHPKLFAKINRHVHADDFYDPFHGKLYAEFSEAASQGSEVSYVTIHKKYLGSEYSTELEDQGIGYSRYMASLAACLVSPGAAVDCAIHVRDLSKKRQLAAIADEIMQQIHKDETSTTILAAESAGKISKISDAERTGATASQLVAQTIEQTRNTQQCTSTGFERLDHALAGGFYAGNMYAFAARMKAGKTAMMATIAYNVATRGGRIRYLCLEMGGKQINDRLIARHGGVNALDYLEEKKRYTPFIQNQLKKAQEDFAKYTITYDDCAGITLDEMSVMLADIGMSNKYDGVIIDYFQLVRKDDTRESDAAFEARCAQRIAQMVKKFPNIWVLTAAQLNRDGEVRGSDGLRMACDVLFMLETVEFGDPNGGTQIEAWLKMTASRYTPYRDIGKEENPAYRLRKDIGPYYEEI